MSTQPKGAVVPTIIRNGSRKQYAVVDQGTLEDVRLTARALGLLTYLLGKPNNWQVQPGDLCRRFNVGKDYVYAMLKELREAGYATRQPVREGSRIIRWETVIYESHNPALLAEKPEVEENEDGDSLLRETPDVEGEVQLPPSPDPAFPDPAFPGTTKDLTPPSLKETQDKSNLHGSPKPLAATTEAPQPHQSEPPSLVAEGTAPPPTDLASKLERVKQVHDSKAAARAADRERRREAQSVSPPGSNPRRLIGGQR